MNNRVLKSTGIATPVQLHLVFLLLGIASASSPVDASVIYTSSDSSLTTGVGSDQQQITQGNFTTFSQSLGVQDSSAYASQTAQLGPDGISVTMSAIQYGYVDSASSTFSVAFTLDAPMEFKLTGSGIYVGRSGITKIDFSGPCFFCSSDTQSGQYDILNVNDPGLGQSNILEAGAYTLFVEAVANGAPYFGNPPMSAVHADLTLTPVPLPPGILLLESGLGALLFAKFRPRHVEQPRPAFG